eukprot:TRINITY_DN13644_c0_g1_i1.p1 TRINITY_DN13644_c0_g1~~TRINITY_DN13644_c0_g1_i1.p1  ORF type:complete len:221 (+),score=51.42 TRINITY_DN13644_c0_g1_i1:72-665(+)
MGQCSLCVAERPHDYRGSDSGVTYITGDTASCISAAELRWYPTVASPTKPADGVALEFERAVANADALAKEFASPTGLSEQEIEVWVPQRSGNLACTLGCQFRGTQQSTRPPSKKVSKRSAARPAGGQAAEADPHKHAIVACLLVGGAAWSAGVKPGMRLAALNGTEVRTLRDAKAALGALRDGEDFVAIFSQNVAD